MKKTNKKKLPKYPLGGKKTILDEAGINDNIVYSSSTNKPLNLAISEAKNRNILLDNMKFYQDIAKTGMSVDEYFTKYPTEAEFMKKQAERQIKDRLVKNNNSNSFALGGFKGSDITLKDVGQFAGNYGKATLDSSLSAFGMGNVINESDYKGQSAQDFNKISNVTGGITKAALPIVAGVAGGMVAGPQGAQMGMSAAKGLQGLGSQINPEDNQGLTEEQLMAQQQGNQAGNMTGQIANLGMQGLNMYNMSKQMKMGGKMCYAQGGINSEVEKQENSIAPDGEFTQYNGPSHENGGIPTNLQDQEMVFSDRLKSGKKTFAELNKAYNTNKEDKLINDTKSNNLQKLTAQLMKEAKMKQSMKLFNEQESLKQARIDKYAGRIGYKFPDGGRKTIDRSAYTKDFQRFDNKGAGDFDISGDISDANFKNLGFTKATNVIDKYPVYMKDNKYLIRNDAGTGYVSAGDVNTLKYLGQDTSTLNSASFGKQTAPIAPTNQFSNEATPIAPPKQPMSFGSNMNFNPNTNQYTNSVTGANITPIVEQYSNGGMKRYDEGGLKTEEEIDPSEEFRRSINGLKTQPEIDPTQGFIDMQNRRGSLNTQPTPQGQGPNWGKMAGQVGMGLMQNVGNIYDINRGRKTETTSYDRATPNLVDPSAEIRYNEMVGAGAREDIRNASVGNSSTYLQNRKDLAINQMMTNARIRQAAANQNAAIKNQTGQFNTNISMRENDANAMNRATGRNLVGSGVSGIGQNIMSQSKDYNMGQRDEDLLGLISQQYPQAMRNPAFANYYQKKGVRTK